MPELMSVAAWLWAGKSPETSVSQVGRAPTVPVPVWRRNFLVAVVFPATRCQAGVELAAIKSPSTGDAATVSGCVPLRRLWFDPPPADAAMVTFTRSLPASSASVSVTFVPSIRLIPRRVPMAARRFQHVDGRRARHVGSGMRVGGQVASHQRVPNRQRRDAAVARLAQELAGGGRVASHT